MTQLTFGLTPDQALTTPQYQQTPPRTERERGLKELSDGQPHTAEDFLKAGCSHRFGGRLFELKNQWDISVYHDGGVGGTTYYRLDGAR